MSVVIFLDGVLRKPNDSPIMEGVNLYRSLNEKQRVIILCDDRVKTERWLKINNIVPKYDDIVDYKDSGALEDDIEFRQVQFCRGRGEVSYVITPNIDTAKQLLEAGVTTLLFLHPKYITPLFRPDAPKGIRSWESITKEMDRQQALYMEDPRV